MDVSGRLERLVTPVGPDTGDRPRTVRDWIVDALALVIATLVGAIAFASQTGVSGTLTAIDLLLGAAGLVLLWWRREHPVALLLVATAMAPLSASSAGFALAMLFTVAVHRPPGTAIALALLSLLPMPLFWLTRETPDGPLVEAIYGIGFSAIVVAWGMFVRARRQLVQSLADRARDAEANQQERMERARSDERARIAREMHDVLAHRLSLLSLHAGALEFRADASPDEVSRAAGVIRAAAHDALGELRDVIGVLRSAPAAEAAPEPPQPGLADLEALLEECRAAGVRVTATVDLDPAQVPTALGRNAYRIVQEGLTNARKHAPGAKVAVRVGGVPGAGLHVQVANPLGVGAAVMPGAGTGLVGVAERASLAGGTLEHGPVDGEFVLRATLPWPA